MVDAIYAQAGIDVEFTIGEAYSNTFVNVGDESPRPLVDLIVIQEQAAEDGVLATGEHVVNLFMLSVVPSQDNAADDDVAGLGGSSLWQWIGPDVPTCPAGRVRAAHLTAHELAHVLGLARTSDPENLMTGTGPGEAVGGQRLEDDQIDTMRSSDRLFTLLRRVITVTLEQGGLSMADQVVEFINDDAGSTEQVTGSDGSATAIGLGESFPALIVFPPAAGG